MLSILPLALAAAVYPTLLVGVVVMLTRPDPRRLLAAFRFGGVLVSVTCGLIIVFVLKGTISASRQRSASPKIDLIAGILSLVLAIGLWARRNGRRPGDRKPPAAYPTSDSLSCADNPRGSDHPSFTGRMLARGSLKSAFAAGMILNLPGIWYLIALKDIAQANHSAVTDVLLILLFNAIMFLIVELPLIGYLVRPDETKARVERFRIWLGDYNRVIAAAAALVIGFYLVIRGIVRLH
jgi:hypothetical protein